jgi:hypothetical protein
MKNIAVYERRMPAASEECQNLSQVAQFGWRSFAQKPLTLVIPKPDSSARNLLAPEAKQQIPRAIRPRFGMTISWGFQIAPPRRIPPIMIHGDFSVH